jgi:hypothetical protein
MQTAASTNQQQSDGGFGELAALPLPDVRREVARFE